MRIFTKTYFFLLFFVFLFSSSKAQNSILIFNEDFETGNYPFVADSSFGLPQGVNSWVINNEYNGNGIYPNTTSQTSTVSGTIGNPNGYYLHITDTTQIINVANANFNPNSTSDHFVVLDRNFCTLGFDSIEFSFFYLCEGSANAYAEVYYSIDGGSWISTGNQYNNQTLWKNERIMNPAFSNVFDLRFGFRWVNASSTLPNSISFGVDDIFLVGNFNQTSNPIDINVTYLSDSVICQGNYLIFRYEISDTLCGGQYLIELSDANGNFTNPTALWTTSMFYPNTSSLLMIQIPNSAWPSLCYKLRVNRISPSPQITGIASVCFEIAICPNVITTGPTPPVVTMDTADVCIGSVIDIPFFATGVYYPGNIFTAYLSDSAGSFANPTIIGQLPSSQTFDPNIAPGFPGSVSGIIPSVPEGCNYYIRVSSVNPVANDTSTWGPFCIRNCDIETNGKQDLQFCISSTDGDSALITIDVNTPPSSVIYYPGNEFQVELLDFMGFSRVNLGGLGSIAATSDTLLWIVVPNFISLSAMGVQPGQYYMRIIATNSNTPDNQLGTVIRLTIGHPDDNPLIINATDSLVCQGSAATLWVSPTQMGSEYLWHLNNQVWPPISTGLNPANAVGALFNGSAGNYNFTVQETNYGCTGPMSPPFTITLLNPPTVNIVPNAPVCFGDSVTYFVQFFPNTYYSWSPPTCGTMLDTSNNQMIVAWDQASGQCNLQVFAMNICGSTTVSSSININPLPNAFAGIDTVICEGDSIMLNASGGNSYSWTPNNTLQNANTSSPIAFPTSSTNYRVQVTDNQNCKNTDTVSVIVNLKPSFDAGNDQTIMCGDSIVLNATLINGAIYNWTPQNNISNNTIYNPIGFPIQTTKYTVEASLIGGCEVIDSITINVNDIIVDVGVNQNITCGDTIALSATLINTAIYNWTPPNNISDNTIYNPIVFPIQTTKYIVDVNTLSGCEAVDSITITVNDIIIDAGIDQTITCGENILLNATFINNLFYSWTPDNTLQNANTNSPTASPIQTTNYIVSVNNTIGCESKDSIIINVNDMIVDAGKDTTICRSSIILGGYPTAVQGSDFEWIKITNEDTLIFSANGNPIVTPIITARYIVNVSNVIGCTNSDTIHVEVLTFQNIDTTFKICKEFSLVLTASDTNSTYIWNTGETEKEIIVTDIGLYTVDILTKDGCLITDSFSIIFDDCEYFFYTPNAFTPNNDGDNDVFLPLSYDVEYLSFSIYNRWGELLFESNDFTPWDGTFKGNPVSSGLYIWKAIYNGKGIYGPEEKSDGGIITLIR